MEQNSYFGQFLKQRHEIISILESYSEIGVASSSFPSQDDL